MVFYLYMFLVSLLNPAVMLFIGYRWRIKPPNKINSIYGYRTKRSMSSKKAWDFAQLHCSKLWVKLGYFTLAFAVFSMVLLALTTLEVKSVGIFGGVIVLIEFIPMSAPLILTERALKHEFGI